MTLLDNIKNISAPVGRMVLPYLRDLGGWCARLAKDTAGACRRAWAALGAAVGKATAHVAALPSETKMYISLIAFLLVFLLWQLLAYDMRQTTFVVVNLTMVTTISLLVFRSMFGNVRKIAQARREAQELSADKARLTDEVRELKDKIRELLSRGNRQQMVEGKGQRLYETLFPDGPDTQPTGQDILEALSTLFGLTGGISFRRQDDGATYAADGRYALSSSPAPETVSADDPFAGQAIADGKPVGLEGVPADYLTAVSGLGETDRLNVYILPMVVGGEVVSLTEVATFGEQDIPQAWDEMENILKKHKAEARL